MLGAAPRLLSADAKKPEDWDDEEDGDWEAPRIANPKCTDAPGCGEWKRPTKAVSWRAAVGVVGSISFTAGEPHTSQHHITTRDLNAMQGTPDVSQNT